MSTKDLSIEFCGVKCENPFFLASAPVAASYDMISRALEAGWAGFVFKTVGFFVADEVSPRFDTLKKEGTPFLGFRNLEQISEKPLEQNLDCMKRIKKDFPNKILIASIMGETEEEWTKLASMVTSAGADIIECNFSCPQMTSDKMGADVGQNPELVKAYTAATKRGTHLPVLAKMTPNLGNMVIPAIASMEGGATGLAAINTIKSITNVNVDTAIAYPAVNGKSSVSGYSGKAVKPIALRFINEIASHPNLKKVPISGIGGIETWQDALEFILLGASNLQVCTAVMQYGYRIVEDMISGLSYYMESKGIDKLEQLVGMALENIVPAENLNRDHIIFPKISDEKCIGCGRCYISCDDGGHQAINWSKVRKPSVMEDKCVGCHLCSQVCPADAIEYGKVQFKEGREIVEIIS
jgi:dihydropyrimidine dehydrogenase (NAD+) subunit PreA